MPRLRPALLAALLAMLPAAARAAAPADTQTWTSVRGDPANTATCRWAEGAPELAIREWTFRGRPGKRFKQGVTVWASPAVTVVNGRPMAFIGGFDQTMHALDLAAKEERWSKITRAEIAESPAIGMVDGAQVVFWGSADRTVYAFRADSGGREDGICLWTKELVPATSTMGDAQMSAPLFHNGVVYISCFVFDRAAARSEQHGWLFALDARTGSVLWKYDAAPGMLSSPVGCELDGRFVVFLAARRGRLQALEITPAGPKEMWHYQMPHEVLGSPALDVGPESARLFLGSKFGNLIALDARTGREFWKRMAGNWIDNSACVGEIAGERVVFVGSHDYKVYALRAADGAVIWARPLGGEIYSAPVFFQSSTGPAVAVASLDNHIYVLDAVSGRVETSYYTGQPMWDKVAKGEVLWGSPAALEAGGRTALVHGSFNGEVYVLPLTDKCELRTKVQSASTLWWGLITTAGLFLGVILPIVIFVRPRKAIQAP